MEGILCQIHNPPLEWMPLGFFPASFTGCAPIPADVGIGGSLLGPKVRADLKLSYNQHRL